MKDWNLLVWLTQLGLSVAVPPVLLILLAKWLHESCCWGGWVIWAGVIFGVVLAIDGLRVSLMAMSRLSRDKKKDAPPPVSYNDHT